MVLRRVQIHVKYVRKVERSGVSGLASTRSTIDIAHSAIFVLDDGAP